MTVKIEMSESMLSDSVRRVEDQENKLKAAMHDTLGISAKIKLVEPHSLPRSEGKAVRVIDNREI